MRRMVGVVGITVLITAAVGCETLAPSWGDRRLELEEQRQVWADAGLDSYRYQVTRGCFCAAPVGTFRVTVTDGDVTAAESTGDGEAVSDEVLPEIPTVEALFTVVEQAIERQVDRLDVEYHPQLGYPTLIDIDRDRLAIDDEVIYQAGELEEL